MRILLLIAIYIGFIGLGLPDSLFGAAWPAIYKEFGIHLSMGSVITVITTLFTMLSSIKSAQIVRWLGTGKTAFYSTMLTVVGILGVSLTGNFWFLVLCAVPLGLGAGAIDTALNNYVAQHYNASQMSFLHCFYGVGVTVSPLLLAYAMSDSGDWRSGYTLAFWMQLGIAVILLLSLPLWRRMGHSDVAEEENTVVLSLLEAARIPGVKLSWALFFFSVAIEMTTGAWGATYLVEQLGLSVSLAARIVTFYYLGIAVGRFLSGILATKMRCQTILKIGVATLGVAIVLLLTSSSVCLAVAALFLIGLGNGPIFPNLTYLTPKIFGVERSAAIIGTQLAVSNMSWLLMPVVCSILGDTLGMWTFPWYLGILFILLLVIFLRFVSRK